MTVFFVLFLPQDTFYRDKKDALKNIWTTVYHLRKNNNVSYAFMRYFFVVFSALLLLLGRKINGKIYKQNFPL